MSNSPVGRGELKKIKSLLLRRNQLWGWIALGLLLFSIINILKFPYRNLTGTSWKRISIGSQVKTHQPGPEASLVRNRMTVHAGPGEPNRKLALKDLTAQLNLSCQIAKSMLPVDLQDQPIASVVAPS